MNEEDKRKKEEDKKSTPWILYGLLILYFLPFVLMWRLDDSGWKWWATAIAFAAFVYCIYKYQVLHRFDGQALSGDYDEYKHEPRSRMFHDENGYTEDDYRFNAKNRFNAKKQD